MISQEVSGTGDSNRAATSTPHLVTDLAGVTNIAVIYTPGPEYILVSSPGPVQF